MKFVHRDYNPATMRFLQPDPIGFAGGLANLYSYVGNDPVNYIDPNGLETEGIGFSFTLSGFGGSFTIGGQYVTDDKGNSGYTFTSGVGTGAPLPNGVGTFDYTKTNADTIFNLRGPGAQIGGGLSTGIGAAGFEATVGNGFTGLTGSIGAGTPGFSAYNIVTGTTLFGVERSKKPKSCPAQ